MGTVHIQGMIGIAPAACSGWLFVHLSQEVVSDGLVKGHAGAIFYHILQEGTSISGDHYPHRADRSLEGAVEHRRRKNLDTL